MESSQNINVASLVATYENSGTNDKKPVIPKKPARIINGRIVWINKQECEDDTDSGEFPSSNAKDQYIDTDSDVDNESSNKLNNITIECVNFITSVLKSLSNLMAFKTPLQERFQDNKEVYVYLISVFRDVEPLQSLYRIIWDKLTNLKTKGTFCLPDLFLDKEVKGSLNIYKTFLSQYAINAKWIGEFMRTNQICQDVCRQVKENIKMDDNVTPESCLYTVFNSLFSFELIINRFMNCLEEGQESRQKAQSAKDLIGSLLSIVNVSIDQDNFLITHKELNLITNRTKETKLTTRFIYKVLTTKLSRRDDKALSRQLILFSDCLYVTLLPGNITGLSSVRQELSLEAMVVSKLSTEDDMENNINSNNSRITNLKWGINIYAREAYQDFFFDDETTLEKFLSKLEAAISAISDKKNVPTLRHRDMDTSKLGMEAPRWQKDNAASYCNGHKCSIKFSHTVRRHHCRADGLLYCDACCSFKLKLKFERREDSKVCELCHRILFTDMNQPMKLREAHKQLQLVFEKKTRSGLKTSWLCERLYNPSKNSFSPPITFFCELDSHDPFLKMYEKVEDKIRHHDIILLGMLIKVGNQSNYKSKLKPSEFIIEHQDKSQAYLFVAQTQQSCNEWVKCLRDSISNYCNNT